MNRRILHDSINQNTNLGEIGIDANLIFDRLLTITDDAGLTPGEPFIIKAKCFPFLTEMTVERISNGIRSLSERGFIFVGIWRGRTIISFNTESFQKFQALRKDYKRRFEFSELSQVVWDQGLHGFRTTVEQVLHENVAISSTSTISSTNTNTVGAGAPVCVDSKQQTKGVEEVNPQDAENFSDVFYTDNDSQSGETDIKQRLHKSTSQLPEGFLKFWDAYPRYRRVARTQCVTAWARGRCEDDSEVILAAVMRLRASEDWKKENGRFVPMAATFIHQRRWEVFLEENHGDITPKPPPQTPVERALAYIGEATSPEGRATRAKTIVSTTKDPEVKRLMEQEIEKIETRV